MDGQGSGDGRRHSIYSQQGQAQLTAARHESVERMVGLVRQLVERVNYKGCGLVMNVAMTGPGEGMMSFHLMRNPKGKVTARIDGGLLVIAGYTCAVREEFQSMIRMVVRNLTLGHYDSIQAASVPASKAPAGPTQPQVPREPGRGLVPVSRPTQVGGTGFVREISLD